MVDYSQVLLLIMRPFKSLSIIAFIIINFVTGETFAQSFGLKIISVSDSSVITKDLQIFDSLWFKCMSDYGRNDVSPLFADHHPGVSKSNPITLLNFISGFDIPFSNMFGFRLIYNQNLNDTVNLYQLDMGWMQLAVLYNKVVLSGIPKPVHVHELLHFAIPFKCNYFVGEGLASLYGGIGATSYKENLPGVLAFIKSKDIHTFSDAMSLWKTSSYFNSIRGTYVLSAYMLDKIRKDFPRETYRNFMRNCKTDEEMINSFKELYKLDSEESVFNRILSFF